MTDLLRRVNWLLFRTRTGLRRLKKPDDFNTEIGGPRFSLETQLQTLVKAKRGLARGTKTVKLPAFVTFDGDNFHPIEEELTPAIRASLTPR